MTIDLPTLMIANAFVSVLCGGFLLSYWWQYRESAAVWWATASLANGCAIALLAFGFVGQSAPLFLAGLTVLLLAPTMTWAGVRRFNHLPTRPAFIGCALAVWLLVVGAGGLHRHDWLPTAVNSLILITFLGAATWQLSAHREEHLRARIPLIGLMAVNSAVLLLAIPDALSGEMRSLQPPPLASMFGLIHFQSAIYAVGTTIFFVAMMKERSEQRNLREAETDALTGLANRRAFLPMAERVAERCARQGEPYCVVVFDLDHFKSVNDRFGHPFGDAVLQVFARIVRETLRPGDIVSRVGGEEFFAVLPNANLKEGCGTADRVCRAFEAAGVIVEGRKVQATVSAGVTASEGELSLAKLLERADAALYRAKLRGRNCVQCGLEEPEQKKTVPHLVRVA